MKIEIETNTIKTNKGISLSICHFSDIHFSIKYKAEILYKIVEKVQEIQPSYICITGDIIDDVDVANDPLVQKLYQFLEDLGKIAPVLFVLGNHDFTNHIHNWRKSEYYFPSSYIENLRKIPGIHLLDNTIYKDKYIQCIGYMPSYKLYKKEKKQEKAFVKEIIETFPTSLSGDRYNLLLIHSPIVIGQKKTQKQIPFLQNMDLILSGHTHAGMMPSFLDHRIKGNRGIIAPNKNIFPKNMRGMIGENPVIVINGAVIKLSRVAGILRHFNFLFPSSLNHIKIIEKNV